VDGKDYAWVNLITFMHEIIPSGLERNTLAQKLKFCSLQPSSSSDDGGGESNPIQIFCVMSFHNSERVSTSRRREF